MSKIEKIKRGLAVVFDDNLHTKKWHNIVDYTIIGLILISTLEVFLSTYSGIVEKYGKMLNFVDYFTTIFFTIEVSLRIWCADLINEKYKGFMGRLRYCFSFYGFIDIISTFPFYLHFFMKIPYAALKALRIARLLRIFRYMKAFRILSKALRSKKDEMIVSLQFLTIVTLILSFILFFVENEAQPEVYCNGWKSVVWSFAQYIGDPGNFADTPPITFTGRIIACVIGILGIAIFAVPAGLIGSGFSDAMEEDNKKNEINENIDRIVHSFKFEKDQHYTNLFCVPRYKNVNHLLMRKYLMLEEVIKAVQNSECLHLYNLANSIHSSEEPEDKLVVVNYLKNRPYGCCIDRGSKLTLVSTSGTAEPLTSWFAFHIAKIGGFNFVSREVEVDPDNPVTYYNATSLDACPNFESFVNDINRLSNRPDSWVIPILEASSPESRPSQIHFCYNTKKHDASYNDPLAKIQDYDTFDKLYNEIESVMHEKLNLNCDKNEWYVINPKTNIGSYIDCKNVFTIRVKSRLYVIDTTHVYIAKLMADSFNKILEPEVHKEIPYEMKERQVGHDFGMNDYDESLS